MSFEIPIDIEIENVKYKIRNRGDYRMILDCFMALRDIQLPERYRIMTALIIFYEDINSIEDLSNLSNIDKFIQQMYWFMNCGTEKSMSSAAHYILIDWKKDEQLICSGINNVAGKEIRFEPYIHWWTFIGYYMAIGESVLSNVVSIRKKILTGKKLEKYERSFILENPDYFEWEHRTTEEIEDENWIKNVWNH